MKIRLQVLNTMLISIFLVTSCTKEQTKPETPPHGKVAKLVRSDFTKGIMTITYDDGTQEVSIIPIDSSAFHLKKNVNAKLSDPQEYMFEDESEFNPPVYDPDLGYFLSKNITWGTGPVIKFTEHCRVHSLDGIIIGYSDPWIEITKNKSVYFRYKNQYDVTRTATVMNLIFYPGATGVSVSICEWWFDVNYYFTFTNPYLPPETQQISYQSIKYVYAQPKS